MHDNESEKKLVIAPSEMGALKNLTWSRSASVFNGAERLDSEVLRWRVPKTST
jgi:hypothetical protein